MKFFKRIAVLLYVTLILFLGCFLLAYASNWLNFEYVYLSLYIIYFDDTLRLIIGSVAAALLLINFFYYRSFSVNIHREKIIAFDNPSGRVSVSLMALEDLVRRMLMRLPEIKDVKLWISASSKNLKIKIRLVLGSEENIPELSSKVQNSVKKKIEEIIGIDEPVNVEIYVGKIIPEKRVERHKEKQKPDDKTDTNIPFQGYRA